MYEDKMSKLKQELEKQKESKIIIDLESKRK